VVDGGVGAAGGDDTSFVASEGGVGGPEVHGGSVETESGLEGSGVLIGSEDVTIVLGTHGFGGDGAFLAGAIGGGVRVISLGSVAVRGRNGTGGQCRCGHRCNRTECS